MATLNVTGEVTNLATIAARGQPDPDPSNDSAAAEVNGQPAADIGVTKTVDNPSPAGGHHGDLHGDGDERRARVRATGVVVTDALPVGPDAGVGDAVAGQLHGADVDRRRP